MKRYDSYKDSGIEWIGEIPGHWEVKRLKQISDVVLGKMLHSEDKGSMKLKPYLRAANLNWLKVDIADLKEMWFSDYELEKLRLKKGDLLVSEGGEVGRTCIWENEIEECYIQNSVHKVTVNQNCNSKYYLFHFFSFGMRGVFDYLVNRISIAHLTVEKIREISFCFPPLPEQTAIAHYLDRKTAEIDELIADKKRLLELYEAEKTAIINQAVTKGLNPDSEGWQDDPGFGNQKEIKPSGKSQKSRFRQMKDSGVEWLGEVPVAWEVKRLKYAAKINPTKNQLYKDIEDDVTFLPMERVGEDGSYDCSIKKSASDLWNGFTYFEKGDIIIAKITPCFENGKGAYLEGLDTEIGFGSTEFHVLRATNVYPSFLYYLTRSELFMELGEAFMTGAAGQKRVPTNFISEFQFCFPPTYEEQQHIVRHIETECARIDAKIAKTEKLIALLTEYRTALISEVVTGKVKVVD